MEGDNVNMILIGNTTFTFTEDSHRLNTNESCQEAKSNYPVGGEGELENPAYLPFQTITITSVQPNQNDLENVERHSQQQPYVFDNNFVQYNYFNRDYSNLTVYVHDPNLLPANNPEQHSHNRECCFSDNIENYPFFSSNNPIDFPFMDRSKIEDGIHYLSKDESDSPEFIDINALMIPSEYQSCLTIDKPTSAASSTQPFPVPPFLKRNRKPNTKNYGNHEDNDDDVIFVREYKKFEKKDESKVYPAPRRNPKRQVQLQKISYELAEKMSMDDYFENNVYCKKEYYMANARRSSRATGAVFSPPDPLSTNDFKKWPVDGMHEKPRYNAVAKKLEKIHQVTKQPKMKIPKTTHNRRKVPNRRRKPKLVTAENDKELENVSHQMLHYVLSYIQQIKECNEILKTNEADAKRNLKHAEELMKNTSLLYCLTTDTTESNLAEYLRTIGEKENAHDFLINIISDFET